MSGIKPGLKRFAKRNYGPYLLLLPSFALIAVFKVYPILYSVVGSFLMRGARGAIKFAGLKNFQLLFADPTILNSIWITIKFNLITVPLQVVLALIFALMLNRKVRFVQTMRTLLYIPVAINMIIASTIWNMMLNPSSGPANAILGALGIPPQPFLTSSQQSLWVIIIICCWKGVSYWMLFLLAGLQNISPSIYEAGRIDGTTFFSELFSLTIPMLKNSLVFVIVSDTMINLFMFIPAYLLTGGGPEGSTDTLMYEAYRAAFKFSNYNRSYAIVTVLMLMTFIVIGLQFFMLRDIEPGAPKRGLLQRGTGK
ncbi:MAG: carbohydrate ABC transporter permease [Spirochaetales bacterium]